MRRPSFHILAVTVAVTVLAISQVESSPQYQRKYGKIVSTLRQLRFSLPPFLYYSSGEGENHQGLQVALCKYPLLLEIIASPLTNNPHRRTGENWLAMFVFLESFRALGHHRDLGGGNNISR